MEIERTFIKICEVLGIGQGDVLAITTVLVSSYVWMVGGWLEDARSHRQRKPIAKSLSLLARFCVPPAVFFLICWLVFVFADSGEIANDSVIAGSLQAGAFFTGAAAIMWAIQLWMGDEEDDTVLISSYSKKELEDLRRDIASSVNDGGATIEEAEAVASAVVFEAIASESLESSKTIRRWEQRLSRLEK